MKMLILVILIIKHGLAPSNIFMASPLSITRVNELNNSSDR